MKPLPTAVHRLLCCPAVLAHKLSDEGFAGFPRQASHTLGGLPDRLEGCKALPCCLLLPCSRDRLACT